MTVVKKSILEKEFPVIPAMLVVIALGIGAKVSLPPTIDYLKTHNETFMRTSLKDAHITKNYLEKSKKDNEVFCIDPIGSLKDHCSESVMADYLHLINKAETKIEKITNIAEGNGIKVSDINHNYSELPNFPGSSYYGTCGGLEAKAYKFNNVYNKINDKFRFDEIETRGKTLEQISLAHLVKGTAMKEEARFLKKMKKGECYDELKDFEDTTNLSFSKQYFSSVGF